MKKPTQKGPYSSLPDGWHPPAGWEEMRPWLTVATSRKRELRLDLRLSNEQIDAAVETAGFPQPILIPIGHGRSIERWVCLEVNKWLAELADSRFEEGQRHDS